MVKETIITKKYINDTVRPYTPNDTLFASTFFETVTEDIYSILGKTICAELLNEDETVEPSTELKEALDGGLRRGIAYLVFARSVRTAQSVVTKYGYVQKDAQEYSTRPDNSTIVTDSNYFKKIGMDIVKDYKGLNKDTTADKVVVNSDNNYNCAVIGF